MFFCLKIISEKIFCKISFKNYETKGTCRVTRAWVRGVCRRRKSSVSLSLSIYGKLRTGVWTWTWRRIIIRINFTHTPGFILNYTASPILYEITSTPLKANSIWFNKKVTKINLIYKVFKRKVEKIIKWATSE